MKKCFKILTPFLSLIIMASLIGCGDKSKNEEANKSEDKIIQEENKKDVTKMSAEELITEFELSGFPINKVINYTAETDTNKLLGRPNQYTSKINFSDSRLEQFDEENEPVGGSIEVFNNQEDAQNRKNYIDEIGKNASIFVEYSYICDNVLLRLDKGFTPEEAEEYKKAFECIANGKSYKFIKTETSTTETSNESTSYNSEEVYKFLDNLLKSEENPSLREKIGNEDFEVNSEEWNNATQAWNEECKAYEDECVKKTAEKFNITTDEVNKIYYEWVNK